MTVLVQRVVMRSAGLIATTVADKATNNNPDPVGEARLFTPPSNGCSRDTSDRIFDDLNLA